MAERDRAVLAADAAARIAGAHCKERTEDWNELERAHNAAPTSRESSEVVADVVQICEGCPALAACAQWARTDEYSGLAAGAAYHRGERMSPRWVSQRSGRRPSARAS